MFTEELEVIVQLNNAKSCTSPVSQCKMRLILACFALFAVPAIAINEKLKEVFHWNYVDYAWEKPGDREAAIASGEFIPANNLPLGLEVWKDKLFITIPRWRDGVVATLTYVKINGHMHDGHMMMHHLDHDHNDTQPSMSSSMSPALIPYPSFEENRVSLNSSSDAKPIVSVFRVWADNCDRLWVMDTGVADILGNTKVHSAPRILIYDLNTDKLLKTYEFKDTDTEQHSFFANIIVDSDPHKCENAFAYVPDLGGYGLISYNLAEDKSRRIKHNYFHFDPLAGNMVVGGVNFQWTDGVFSVALGKSMPDGYRTAYFHCLASTKEFSVNTRVLKNGDSSKDSYYDFQLVGDRGADSQSSASYIHEGTGVMFYTQLQKNSVNCWNTNKPLVQENLAEVASDNETMIFTNDLKVDREGKLWVLTDKLPVFIYRGLDEKEINYRIFSATVEEAIAGTSCAP
ncbi:hypothetical protein RUM43_010028 [Polyplax serrata]|uniref:Protein yellow n=1 Tax=Polyplax serrata TaxID=468196 RepID=A0AAN8P3L4_POLSC